LRQFRSQGSFDSALGFLFYDAPNQFKPGAVRFTLALVGVKQDCQYPGDPNPLQSCPFEVLNDFLFRWRLTADGAGNTRLSGLYSTEMSGDQPGESIELTPISPATWLNLSGLTAADLERIGGRFATPIEDLDSDGIPNDEDNCPTSDLRSTVFIEECNSRVSNVLFPTGCTIADTIKDCSRDASSHGQFVSCVAQFTNDLKRAGTITGQQKGAIQSCAAQAHTP
jgi:hypothetical protein